MSPAVCADSLLSCEQLSGLCFCFHIGFGEIVYICVCAHTHLVTIQCCVQVNSLQRKLLEVDETAVSVGQRSWGVFTIPPAVSLCLMMWKVPPSTPHNMTPPPPHTHTTSCVVFGLDWELDVLTAGALCWRLCLWVSCISSVELGAIADLTRPLSLTAFYLFYPHHSVCVCV